jgi:hypothetical protein
MSMIVDVDTHVGAFKHESCTRTADANADWD